MPFRGWGTLYFVSKRMLRSLRAAAVGFVAPLLVACGSGGSNFETFDASFADGTTRHDGSSGPDGVGKLHTPDASADVPPPCTGLQCQVKACSGGVETTVTGTVYAPNGTLPLYNVQVFIPNAPLQPFTKGVQCDQCGAALSGDPITTALSDATGQFTLKGVPSGTNIPIVVQLGKWRREATIPSVPACTTTTLTDANLTRLPKTQAEGSMPHVALTTGGCDSLGCMLPKVGIDPSEFGYEADAYTKAINTYTGAMSTFPAGTATPASNLWGNATTLDTYDMAIFSCECSEAPTTKGSLGSAAFGIVTDYMDHGGRIFTTDYQYTWYRYSPDPALGVTGSAAKSCLCTSPGVCTSQCGSDFCAGSAPSAACTTCIESEVGLGGACSAAVAQTGIGDIIGGAPTGGEPITLAQTFPKGVALATWLKTVFPSDTFAQMGQVEPDVVFSNIASLNAASTVTWASSASPQGPRVFTVNTPVGSPTASQCGKGVHIDAHVDQHDVGNEVTCSAAGSSTCYPATCATALKPDEAMFAFFFFDLASCIQNDTQPPPPPPIMPK